MASNDFFDALDAAEAEVGRLIVAVKQETKVRYWYEEGYVPGNEKDADDEDSEQSDDDGTPGEAASDSDASSTIYEEVHITSSKKHGGRRVRWGGINGKLALADALPGTVAKLNEVLDELLMPMGDTGASSRSNDARLSEETAIVMAQMTQETPCWSYGSSSCLAIQDEQLEEEYEATKTRYAIEDGSVSLQVRSEEEQMLAQVVKVNDAKRQEARREFLRNLREEERNKRSIERGSHEQLPGARKALALSQAWQERKAETSGKKLEIAKPSGRSMLPCSLSNGSSSQQKEMSKELSHAMRYGTGQSEKMILRRPIAQQQAVLHEAIMFDSDRQEGTGVSNDGPQPLFKVPSKPMPKYKSNR